MLRKTASLLVVILMALALVPMATFAKEAKPEKTEYTLTFLAPDSSPMKTVVKKEDKFLKNPPKLKGSDTQLFLGWLDNDTGNPVDFETMPITRDQTFYPHFLEKFAVTFDMNGGKGTIKPQYIPNGSTAADPDKPNRPKLKGYDFVGWYLDPNGSGSAFDFSAPITGPTTLYAKYAPAAPGNNQQPGVQHTVTFVGFDGNTVLKTLTVGEGTLVNLADAPSLETNDRHQLGWFYQESGNPFWAESTPITSDIRLMPWVTNKYTVTYYGFAGTSSAPLGQEFVLEGQTPAQAPVVAVDKDHDLLGWFDAHTGNPYDMTKPVYGNVDLMPWTQYNPKALVTYRDTSGNVIIGTELVPIGGTIQHAPTIYGDNATDFFKGWMYDSGKPYPNDPAITGDVTLYPWFSPRNQQ